MDCISHGMSPSSMDSMDVRFVLVGGCDRETVFPDRHSHRPI